jgi:hypothetical protein
VHILILQNYVYNSRLLNMKNEHSLLFIFRTTSLCASRTNIFIIWYVYILWCKILSIFLLRGIHISLISRLNTNVHIAANIYWIKETCVQKTIYRCLCYLHTLFSHNTRFFKRVWIYQSGNKNLQLKERHYNGHKNQKIGWWP